MTKNGRPSPNNWGKTTLVCAVGLVLAWLMVWPFPQGDSGPIVAGVIPTSYLLWIIWTTLFILLTAWIAYKWDPYADVVARNLAEDANEPEVSVEE